MTLWLDFLHFYFVALSALTVGALSYLAWLLLPQTPTQHQKLNQGVGETVEEGVGVGTSPSPMRAMPTACASNASPAAVG
jgi:hypothetical protein